MIGADLVSIVSPVAGSAREVFWIGLRHAGPADVKRAMRAAGWKGPILSDRWSREYREAQTRAGKRWPDGRMIAVYYRGRLAAWDDGRIDAMRVAAQVRSAMLARLVAHHPRMGDYGRGLLDAGACWSGADLEGKARRYGAHYARTRAKVRRAVCGSVQDLPDLPWRWMATIVRGSHGRMRLVVACWPVSEDAPGVCHGS